MTARAMREAYVAYEMCEWRSSPLAEPRYSNPKKKKFRSQMQTKQSMQSLNRTLKQETTWIVKRRTKVSGATKSGSCVSCGVGFRWTSELWRCNANGRNNGDIAGVSTCRGPERGENTETPTRADARSLTRRSRSIDCDWLPERMLSCLCCQYLVDDQLRCLLSPKAHSGAKELSPNFYGDNQEKHFLLEKAIIQVFAQL